MLTETHLSLLNQFYANFYTLFSVIFLNDIFCLINYKNVFPLNLTW